MFIRNLKKTTVAYRGHFVQVMTSKGSILNAQEPTSAAASQHDWGKVAYNLTLGIATVCMYTDDVDVPTFRSGKKLHDHDQRRRIRALR